MKAQFVIGIDPDVKRNGYAFINMETKEVVVETVTLPVLLDMVDVIQSTALATDKNLIVYVEAGWLRQSNWHLTFKDSKQRATAKGHSVGRNHQRGMDIIELLAYRGITVEAVPPLDKKWRGPDHKITHDELERVVGPVKHTNQEGRDAVLLAWVHGRKQFIKKTVKRVGTGRQNQ